MNDGTFDGAIRAINGHERTGFIARVKFRPPLADFFSCSVKKRRE